MDLTSKEVAELLNLSEITVHRWAQAGHIPAYQLNGKYRFSRSKMQDWLLQRKQEEAHDRLPKEEISEELSSKGMQQYSLYRAIYRGGVFRNVQSTNKTDIIRQTVENISSNLGVDAASMTEMLLERENLTPTALGDGIGVPHPRESASSREQYHDSVTVVFPETPIDYSALDGKPVHTMFFLFACDDRRHLNLLAKIAHLSSDPASLAFLQTKPNKEDLLQYIRTWEGKL
jgi:PTS system nitrogen regulatory IIA component